MDQTEGAVDTPDLSGRWNAMSHGAWGDDMMPDDLEAAEPEPVRCEHERLPGKCMRCDLARAERQRDELLAALRYEHRRHYGTVLHETLSPNCRTCALIASMPAPPQGGSADERLAAMRAKGHKEPSDEEQQANLDETLHAIETAPQGGSE